jgi:hypothetical protein
VELWFNNGDPVNNCSLLGGTLDGVFFVAHRLSGGRTPP